MKIIKKTVSILLSLLMIVSVFTIVPFEAFAAETVEYIERSWDEAGQKVVDTTKTCSSYTTITSQSNLTIGNGGWYVVNGNATISNRVTVSGTAHIILLSGTLTCQHGIHLKKDNSLFIYPGKNSEGTLDAKIGDDEEANIGGNEGESCGEFEFHGGTLKVKNDDWSSGGTAIGGGGEGGSCGALSFYGGTVKASNDGGGDWRKSYGAAIGDGDKADSTGPYNHINIYGGDITANNYRYSNAACIGGGNKSKCCPINIYGGKITVIAESGAGIGSGEDGVSNTITIKNAVVDAESDYGAGIGSGEDSDSESIIIENSYVKAETKTDSGGKGAEGAGIGGGNCGKSKYIKINQSVIFASSGRYGAGIGGGDERDGGVIEITDSDVFAHSAQGGAGIGGGDEKGCDSITIKRSYVSAVTDSKLNTFGERFLREYGDFYNGILNSLSGPESSTASAMYSAGAMIAMLIAHLIEGTHTGAGIGSGDSGNVESINIEDSVILATGGECAAGIGGGDEGGFDTINVTNSTVYANGGKYAASIGTGDEAEKCGAIFITDSDVTAKAGTDAAGIGTGNEVDETARIEIKNSKIESHGGNYGAGIGGGDAVGGGRITITSGSNVKAYGGEDAAGIGGGEGGYGGTIYIGDSVVYAEGSYYGAGIGGGEDSSAGTLYVRGDSTVEAVAGAEGNSVAVGHGDYSTFKAWLTGDYPSNGTIDIEDNLHMAMAGSSKNTAGLYNKNTPGGVVYACQNNKYARIYACEHEHTEMRAINGTHHAYCCTYCGRVMSDEEKHVWGSDNKCTVCGTSAEMVTITFVEKNDGGNVTRTVKVPRYSEYNMPKPENSPEGQSIYYWKNSNDNVLLPGDEIEAQTETYTAVYIAAVDTTYIDKNGVCQSVTAGVLPTDVERFDMYPGWYIINSDYSQEDAPSFSVKGDVNLILADDVTWSGTYLSFTDGNMSNKSTFSVYGQSKQTGTISVNSIGSFYNYAQYGGKVNTVSLDAYNSCTLAGGNFEAFNLSVNNLIELGWTRWEDTIKVKNYCFGGYDNYPNLTIKVADDKRLRYQSGSSATISGVLTKKDVTNVISGTTLYPDSELNYFRTPQWTWSADGTEAEALFECTSDSAYDARIKAKITYSYEGTNRVSTATVKFRGETYTATKNIQTKWFVWKGSHTNGDIELSKSVAARDDTVEVTVTPDEGYAVKAVTAVPSGNTVEVEVRNNSFKMPECNVTVNAEFVSVTPQTEPYIDSNGAYILGTKEHYETDGKNYAVNGDGSIGEELSDDELALSYFDFSLINNDTEYQINYYTGPTDNLTELVIPKTFNGKPITVLGNNNDERLYSSTKTQFELVLNENIREIKGYTFYVLYVTKVKGDTSSLNNIGDYAFSWANSPGDYKVDLNLDYPGTITVNTGAFNNMNITAHLKHSTKLSSTAWAQSVTYDFTDAHPYGNPIWTWAEDYSSATAKFTCSDSRCKHEETADAEIISEYENGAPKYTAKTTFEGETHTDVKALNNPLDASYSPSINAANALEMDKNLFKLPSELVYTKAKLLGVQKKETIKTDTAGTGMRFVAELSSEFVNKDNIDYGFEVVKTSKNNTSEFNAAGGFDIMQDLIDNNKDNIKSISCKNTSNNITGDTRYGDNDDTSTEYKYVTLAVNNIPDNQGIAVRFYVEIDGIRYYSGYTDSKGTSCRGCCASYVTLANAVK